MITRKEYMSDSSNLHHKYYAQFITEATKRFVLGGLSVEKIRKAFDSGDEHLNEIKIPYNNMSRGGGWWWDEAPVDVGLMREAGEIGPGSLPSMATHTCVGKAAARVLAERVNA
jgi:hypothetical protein